MKITVFEGFDLEDPKACEFIDWLNTEFKNLIIIVTFLIKYNNYDRGDNV